MARIRTIKPEFWSDERVAECSPSARLLFIASWNFADDYGSIDRSAKQLKAQAFRYDNLDCEPLVAELLGVGLFIEYGVIGRKFLHIKGFRKHQRIDKKGPNRVPIYESSTNDQGIVQDYSANGSRAFAPVRESKGMESKGREGKGIGGGVGGGPAVRDNSAKGERTAR